MQAAPAPTDGTAVKTFCLTRVRDRLAPTVAAFDRVTSSRHVGVWTVTGVVTRTEIGDGMSSWVCEAKRAGADFVLISLAVDSFAGGDHLPATSRASSTARR